VPGIGWASWGQRGTSSLHSEGSVRRCSSHVVRRQGWWGGHGQALHLVREHRSRAIGSWGRFQGILQVPSKLLSIRAKVEEGFTLLESHPLLLCHHGKLLVSILLPLIAQTVPPKCLIVEGIQLILGLKGLQPPLGHHLSEHFRHVHSLTLLFV